MILNLPNNGVIDTQNITPEFENIVKKSFAGYTEGTNPEYMYQDKLCYLDRLRKVFHRVECTSDAVNALIKEDFAYALDEFGEIKGEEDFYNIEFMEECFDAGFLPMYLNGYGATKRNYEKDMKVLLDIIKIVVNYKE